MSVFISCLDSTTGFSIFASTANLFKLESTVLLENKSVVALLIFNTDSLAVPNTPPSPNKEPSFT